MPERDEFYVGYLALPRAHRRFLQVALPLVVFAMVFSAAGIALTQRDPGAGVWQTGEASNWEGALRVDPYPTLLVEGEDAGAYLLVRMGKRGAADIARPFADERVRVRGRLLEREGRRMIELDDAPGEPDPIARLLEGAAAPPQAPTPLGRVTLSGEILDAKCYLGAMKPGDGRAHKACATLCVSGGVPPVLVSIGPDGSRRYTLLADGSGGPRPDALLPFIGEPVTLSGELEGRVCGPTLRVDPASVRRR